MGSARRLLLLAAMALAIASDARTDAVLSTLTLSPDAGSLITTRDDSTTTDTAHTTSGDAVIGSAASDSNKDTEAPATESPIAASASGSSERERTDAPSSASATVSPGSETRTDAATTSSSLSSQSSTASVDTLNDRNGSLSTGGSSSIATVLPVVFGALACVGAIVMAVTYKKKRDARKADDSSRSSSDCGYTGGANFTPDNRVLATVQEDLPPAAIIAPTLSSQVRADLSASAAIADFTGTNSSVSTSSPFGSTRCKVRISSPVRSCYSSSESNMEFQDTCSRHDGGSNVVLTFQEVVTDSAHVAPQVQL